MALALAPVLLLLLGFAAIAPEWLETLVMQIAVLTFGLSFGLWILLAVLDGLGVLRLMGYHRIERDDEPDAPKATRSH